MRIKLKMLKILLKESLSRNFNEIDQTLLSVKIRFHRDLKINILYENQTFQFLNNSIYLNK